MCVRALRYFRVILIALIVFFTFLLPVKMAFGRPAQGQQGPPLPTPYPGRDPMSENSYLQSTVDVFVKGPNGVSLEGTAVVTLTDLRGQVLDQKTAKEGYARFNDVPPSEYTIQVVSPKYERTSKRLEVSERSTAKITIEMTPFSDAEDAAASVGISALPPKAQKETGKALEDLRVNKSNDARTHLEAARKIAPTSAEVEYLMGVYWSQMKDQVQAQSCWMKTLELNPKHLSALLAVSNLLLQQNKPADALPYLNRAFEAEPSSWRVHALLAEAFLLRGSNDEAITHAQRAIDLGHERAAAVQPVLARARAAQGQEPAMHGAMRVLQEYVQAHPDDVAAARDLEKMKNERVGEVSNDPAVAARELAALKDATALPVPSKWLPPDVDEKVPPVEAGAACSVDDVVNKAGKQLIELVKDVDRFAATESLLHESINKNGLASYPEKRKFDYVVSIQEVQRGYLNVEEYRNGSGGSAADFPDGVATNGLPALVLIFHPYNAVNFEIACEGLARWNGGLAWQVHFKQRTDKPNTIKRYRIGADGPSYPVALKGRAWISADNYQIVRLETDLVSPVPQIRLMADHSDIEYGPVKFNKSDVRMWLPQSADVYYDWKGRRIHRRHSFSNYLLFSVDDKQKISVPKVDESPAASGPSDTPKQKS